MESKWQCFSWLNLDEKITGWSAPLDGLDDLHRDRPLRGCLEHFQQPAFGTFAVRVRQACRSLTHQFTKAFFIADLYRCFIFGRNFKLGNFWLCLYYKSVLSARYLAFMLWFCDLNDPPYTLFFYIRAFLYWCLCKGTPLIFFHLGNLGRINHSCSVSSLILIVYVCIFSCGSTVRRSDNMAFLMHPWT